VARGDAVGDGRSGRTLAGLAGAEEGLVRAVDNVEVNAVQHVEKRGGWSKRRDKAASWGPEY
jgi:hypothetical protein